ncbi:DNA (cytosine-5)-methyltransferase 1 [Mesobacillus persicus]|uniref:Cytosine-specific methyltransferase n=1 Tax=Mesobacillus persicus TaxID=930146 RepID=A0A1H7XPW3_9BACI|nr:DNA (cytosine-5-)-methyltransferase [Mesobacillus persicus]SEM35830.1 DNA (cytosine-5)-methyltransferase 1 [Mesobacillus persicus]
MIFRKGELFCGPGGLSLGAKMVEVKDENNTLYKVEHAWANDYHEDTCKTFRHNICPDKPETVFFGDVKELDIKSLPPIDAFAFGFPCNDFSLVGETKGLEGEYGGLYSYGIKVLKHHKPKWFIAENVGGLESANEGKAFIQILTEMERAGYTITPHKYKFEEYGVPQARHRIIIVGFRKDLGLRFEVPKAPFKNKKDWKSSKQALENPPIPEDALNHEFTRHDKKVIEMLSHINPGDNCWVDYLPEHLRLNVKKTKMSNIYRRLHPETPAYTVTGSGGGGTHMYHYEEPRALTNRERARLQTFPDWYEFIGGKESARKQIGMAVPVEGAKIIVEAILKTYAKIPYETEPARWDEEYIQNMVTTGEKKKRKGSTRKTKKKNEVDENQQAFQLEESK